jgi:glycerophosphoryl diester phosphodiesterase
MKRWASALVVSIGALLAIATGSVTLHRDDGASLARKLGLPFPTVMAHRGASYRAPEETALSYRLAQAVGADFLEADIQRTQDGVLIALHDDTLERTTDVARVFPGRQKQPVSAFTWDELARLDAGSWFNAKFPDRARPEFARAKILRLDELIDIALSGSAPSGLYLETKSPERFPGIEAELVKQLTRRGYLTEAGALTWPGKLVFQSFSAESLRNFQTMAASVPRIYLLDEAMVRAHGYDALVNAASALGSGIGPIGYYAYPWHTRRAHAAGLLVHPYTLNQGWQLRLARWFGVDGVFTDRCEVAVPMFGRRAAVDVDSLWPQLGSPGPAR